MRSIFIPAGFVRIRLLKVEDVPEAPASTFPVEITHQMDLPDDDTTYWCSVHKLPPELRRKHHVIQVQKLNELRARYLG